MKQSTKEKIVRFVKRLIKYNEPSYNILPVETKYGTIITLKKSVNVMGDVVPPNVANDALNDILSEFANNLDAIETHFHNGRYELTFRFIKPKKNDKANKST